MSERSELHSHKRGRTAFEVPERKWPVVTREMLKHVQETGAPSESENPLVTSLLRGYVLNVNVEIHLKRALQEAVKKRDKLWPRDSQVPLESRKAWLAEMTLIKRIEAQLLRVQQVKEEWPLEIVK